MNPPPLNILLSAYACEPNRGSEPGVGWRWSRGLVGSVNLTVLTRRNNREVIEGFYRSQASERPPTFVYYDLPGVFLRLKKAGILPNFAYYIIWQLAVARKFRALAEQMDVVHHLTFCNLLCPGFWRLRRPALVIGPVGAPQVDRRYLELFGRGALPQRLRGAILRRFDRLPWLRRLLRRADAIVPANSDTARLIESKGFPTTEVMLDTGAPEGSMVPRGRRETDGVELIFAGQLERRKGLELALRALAKVEASGWRFTVVGDGPDRERLERLAEALGLSNRVHFAGRQSHDETLRRLRTADVFVFTSIRDTSAGVNLEAMAAGLPVVCLSHQGVADITTDECAERVEPGSIEETVKRLARALERMIGDENLRTRMGEAAKRRADTAFSWEEKFERMTCLYREVVNARHKALEE